MTKPISPLRQRMLDDMTFRNMSPATKKVYSYAVANFSAFHGRSPDKLGIEEATIQIQRAVQDRCFEVQRPADPDPTQAGPSRICRPVSADQQMPEHRRVLLLLARGRLGCMRRRLAPPHPGSGAGN